jgi:hypothetical protein
VDSRTALAVARQARKLTWKQRRIVDRRRARLDRSIAGCSGWNAGRWSHVDREEVI